MKKALPLLFAAFCFFSSCSKSDDNSTVPAQTYSSSVSMTGKIDGRTWGASAIDANVNKLSNGELELVINGVQGYNNELISLTLNNFSLNAQSYQINKYYSNAQTASARYQPGTQKNDAAEGNVVVVFASREAIKGNYWFTIADGTKIEGVFTVSPVYNY